MTIEDHQESRLVADPLHLFDICLESDGACAIVVSRSDIAASLAKDPVYILAAAEGGGARTGNAYDFYTAPEMADDYSGEIAGQLWEMAGVGPADVDVAAIYDCFTSAVLSQIEGFGLCPLGEGGAFVREGRIKIGGDVPVNTHGGMLSEAYIHGLNGLLEAVEQLRGECGERQVEGAKVALGSGFAQTTGSAVVMGKAL
jgi:acetyl-CoA acetyltransferase